MHRHEQMNSKGYNLLPCFHIRWFSCKDICYCWLFALHFYKLHVTLAGDMTFNIRFTLMRTWQDQTANIAPVGWCFLFYSTYKRIFRNPVFTELFLVYSSTGKLCSLFVRTFFDFLVILSLESELCSEVECSLLSAIFTYAHYSLQAGVPGVGLDLNN